MKIADALMVRPDDRGSSVDDQLVIIPVRKEAYALQKPLLNFNYSLQSCLSSPFIIQRSKD